MITEIIISKHSNKLIDIHLLKTNDIKVYPDMENIFRLDIQMYIA